MKTSLSVSLLLLAAGAALARTPVPTHQPGSLLVPPKRPDRVELPQPDEVHLEGWLGQRVANNEKNRLMAVSEDRLLAGFRHRPGEQSWIGEHVGKWLHAATLAWMNTGDAALKQKLDHMAAELIKTQEPDGYLGTYVPDKRMGLYPGADWDVWVHKYDLLGLLTYYQYTGNEPALAASRKVGDLLINTFGPGKKSINSAGTHMGMAATSVLEPMVLLYRTTGDRRYLDFAQYIVSAWDETNGPKVLHTLLTDKAVARTANGKAYEMLSNLVGLCELARATGNEQYQKAAEIAWEDIRANELYITGTASYGEHFHNAWDLPNQQGANVGETCVTVTWIQLNAQLLRLTGEAKYGDEMERSYYNHLAAAQRPDGSEWCYYTSLDGSKPYGPGINCCVSSGPRGMALAPQLAYLKLGPDGKEGLAVNLYDSSKATLRLAGQPVTVEQKSNLPLPRTGENPFQGESTLTIHVPQPTSFALRLRSPAWADDLRVRAGGKESGFAPGGWATLPARIWKDGDKVEIRFRIPPRIIGGEHTNSGKSILEWGPMFLAYDEARNPGLPSARAIAFVQTPAKPPFEFHPTESDPLAFQLPVRVAGQDVPKTATFVPFSEAGSSGGHYAVWVNGPTSKFNTNGSQFAYANEARSREGNVGGSINDGDPKTFAVTFDQRKSREDWYSVERKDAVPVRRIVFSHGRCFHDGGWFDASAGKPRIEARREPNGPWVTIARIDDYPATTSTNSAGLSDGQTFTVTLPQSEKICALRVIGKPASGDNAAQAFSSCAELQAFAE